MNTVTKVTLDYLRLIDEDVRLYLALVGKVGELRFIWNSQLAILNNN